MKKVRNYFQDWCIDTIAETKKLDEAMKFARNADVERYNSIVEQMQLTFLKKNHDYGNSFATTWREFGDKGIVTGVARISDKYHRLLNLSLGTEPLVDESIDDTLMDMANYCILTLMELEKARMANNTDEKE